MGLPDNGAQWPPQPYDQLLKACQTRQVWWEGDPEKLTAHYAGGVDIDAPGVGGRFRAAIDAFWGRPRPTASEPKRVHAPVAATIVRIAAATLFSEPVTFRDPGSEHKDNTDLQDRIDLVLNTDDMYSRLLTAAESASVFGGVFGRVVWNEAIRDNSWIDFVDTDRVLPTFDMGVLTAATFWSELESTPGNQSVWRHFEHHSKGLIEHALYEGDSNAVGVRRELGQHPGVQHLQSIVVTGSDRLTAEYFPNRRPDPAWRSSPALRHLGRSDLSSDVINILDRIDEVWSSLMRDLEIGKGRVFVSDSLLQVNGPGKGSAFNLDSTIFTPVGAASNNGEETSLIQAEQFNIRPEEHGKILDMLLRLAIARSGYSPLTFGLQDEVAVTATETDAKERDTNATRSAKIRLWSGLASLATAQLDVEAYLFGGPKPEELIEVDWPPSHQQSEQSTADTLESYFRSESMSTETRVRRANPEQDDEWIKEEVERINEDKSASMPSTILGPDESNFGPAVDELTDPIDPAEPTNPGGQTSAFPPRPSISTTPPADAGR